ncbi:MAG: phosphoribosylformylglycinamidine cyclo-ligase, partial [Planctomycetes bacterium]|nr:phosphoribosylformylglycinamidine cyclo-ligase [Planctomycetota bacterium]
RQAGISIPGGELAQIADMLAGARPGTAFDLCGTAIGLVPLSEVNVGREVAPGDVVVGIASSGLHSNGYSLARRVLLSGDSGLALDRFVPGLGRTLADELLEPTAIYVDLCHRVRAADVRPHAYLDITGDGLLNLLRVEAEVSFRVDALPEPAPIFRLIEERGRVTKAEMFRTFNMGVGFALVVAPRDADRAIAASREAGHAAHAIGRVERGPRRVYLVQHALVGEGSDFRPA